MSEFNPYDLSQTSRFDKLLEKKVGKKPLGYNYFATRGFDPCQLHSPEEIDRHIAALEYEEQVCEAFLAREHTPITVGILKRSS